MSISCIDADTVEQYDTIPAGIQLLMGEHAYTWNEICHELLPLPVLVLFLFGQKYFIAATSDLSKLIMCIQPGLRGAISGRVSQGWHVSSVLLLRGYGR